jgi:hypothetical protein
MINWKEIGRRSVTLEKRNQIWKNVLKSKGQIYYKDIILGADAKYITKILY